MTVRRALAVAMVLTVAAAPALAGAPKGWKTYADARSGWSIAYPANFQVNARYVDDLMEHPPRGVSFAVPEFYKNGTNLNDASLSIEMLPGKRCKPAQFVDDPQDIVTVQADGRTYIRVSASDAGMSHYHETTLYLIKGTCMAVRYLTFYTNAGVIDPPPKEFDARRLAKLFDSIRATLTLTK